MTEQFRVVGSDGWESDANGYELFTDREKAELFADACDVADAPKGERPVRHRVQRQKIGPWEDVPAGGEQA